MIILTHLVRTVSQAYGNTLNDYIPVINCYVPIIVKLILINLDSEVDLRCHFLTHLGNLFWS